MKLDKHGAGLVGGGMQETVFTVLIVEDDDGVRNLIRTLLRLAGIEALSCQDGEEALDLLRARGGNIQLVISDVNLGPAMDGIELAGNLRSLHPCLKTLFISGREDEDRINREVESGRAFFLSKPFRPRDLVEKVKLILSAVAAPTVPFRI